MQVLINKKVPANVVNGNEKFWKQINADKWERETFAFLDRFLDKQHSFINIGAWIGAVSIYASYFCKKVYSIEPDKVAYEKLKRNIELNNCHNIDTYDFALSDKNGQERLYSVGEFGNSRSTLEPVIDTQITIVKTCHFNTFIKENDIRDCGLIKMDIEGACVKIVPTMKRFLFEYKPVISIAIHSKIAVKREIIEMLDSIFNVYKYAYDGNGTLFERGRYWLVDHLEKTKKNFTLIFTDKMWKDITK